MGYTLLIICALIIAIRIYKGQKDIKQEEQKKQPTAAEVYMSKQIDRLSNSVPTSSSNQVFTEPQKDDGYVLYTEDVYAGNTYAIFMKRDVLEEVKRGKDDWTFDDVILKKVRVTNNGTKHYLPMANREILYRIVNSWYKDTSDNTEESIVNEAKTLSSTGEKQTESKVESNSFEEVKSNSNNDDDILKVTNLKTILKIDECHAKEFVLFNKKIEFSKEKMSFINLLDYCSKLKRFSIHKFEEEWQKTYIANDKENFDRNIEIISDIFANIYVIFDNMWKSIGYEKTVESILESYQIDSLWTRRSGYNCKHTSSEFVGVTDMYLTTAIGKLNMYNHELKEALRKARFEVEFNKPPKHTGSWIGGGFGLKGALKGAFTAAALNAVESTIVNIGNSLSSKSISAETLDDIKEMKRNIEGLHEKVTEETLVSDINVIINALFMATTMVTNIGFSYQKYLNGMESAKKGLSYNTDSLINAIEAYPFAEKHYDFIEQHFYAEEKHLGDIKFYFRTPLICRASIDFMTIRKRKLELAKLMTAGYTYEENGHHKEAIEYYRQMLKIDAENEDAKDGLARLNVAGYTRKKIITDADLYNSFVRDYRQIADNEFIREGLANARKLNEFCFRDDYGYIRLRGRSRLNDKIAELIFNKKARELVQAQEILYVPAINERKQGTSTFKEYVFVNGRTVAYKRNCCYGINYWDDIAHAQTGLVINSRVIDNIIQQNAHLKK